MRLIPASVYMRLLGAVQRALRWIFPNTQIDICPKALRPPPPPVVVPPPRLEALYPPGSFTYRHILAGMYLKGDGIEIGALHNPLLVPPQARVKYVDRMSVEDLRKHYPEFNHVTLMPVSIIDSGERLATVPDESQDFVILNSVIEHCENPLGTIENMLRVLKVGGVFFMAVPDKRYIFDRDRPITPIEHLLADYPLENPPRDQHFEEWTRYICGCTADRDIQLQKEELIAKDYSIHFHCWTQAEMMEMLIVCMRRLGLCFHVKMMYSGSDEETVFILEKRGNKAPPA